jgi:hypothetical protein
MIAGRDLRVPEDFGTQPLALLRHHSGAGLDGRFILRRRFTGRQLGQQGHRFAQSPGTASPEVSHGWFLSTMAADVRRAIREQRFT